MSEKILVVDDDTMNLKMVGFILKKWYEVNCVQSGEACLAYLEETIPDMILLDIYMPRMNGFEVMEHLKADERYKEIPVIFLTADEDKDTEVKCFLAGALDFITKPFVSEIVIQRVSRLMELIRLRNHLELEVKKQTAKAEERQHQMEQMSLQTVQSLAGTIDAKDTYTKGHSYRVAEYAVLLAAESGWEKTELDDLRHAALLHDIGKISVPDSILNKPSGLTEEEYNVIKSHAIKGGEILQCITAIEGADLVARHHHERYDGFGYPDGLSGTQIPEKARIIAIADSYDAMNSRRIYRMKLTKEQIRQELVNGRGTQFDPDYVDLFIKMLDEDRLNIPEQQSADLESDEKNIENVSGMLFERVIQTMNSQKNPADTDYLTGLLLRSEGEILIAEAMQEENGCLAFLDVDNLKKVNDTVGHKAGDRVIKMMGDILKEHIGNGIACRLGGDEFLLYMKGVSQKEASNRAEEIISRFMERKTEDTGIRQASLSIGMCMTTPLDVYSDVYNRADKALYHVKQNGKAGYGFYLKEEIVQRKGSIDLTQLVDTLKTSGDYNGAMYVEYREFAKLFEYVGGLKERYAHSFHLLMITLESRNSDVLYVDELEEAMTCMEYAIKEAIRSVDIYTRYSSVQYLVILFEAGSDNVNMIANRIFSGFYKRCRNNRVVPYYSVTSTKQTE